MYKFHINAHEGVEGVWSRIETSRTDQGRMEGEDHAFQWLTDE